MGTVSIQSRDTKKSSGSTELACDHEFAKAISNLYTARKVRDPLTFTESTSLRPQQFESILQPFPCSSGHESTLGRLIVTLAVHRTSLLLTISEVWLVAV